MNNDTGQIIREYELDKDARTFLIEDLDGSITYEIIIRSYGQTSGVNPLISFENRLTRAESYLHLSHGNSFFFNEEIRTVYFNGGNTITSFDYETKTFTTNSDYSEDHVSLDQGFLEDLIQYNNFSIFTSLRSYIDRTGKKENWLFLVDNSDGTTKTKKIQLPGSFYFHKINLFGFTSENEILFGYSNPEEDNESNYFDIYRYDISNNQYSLITKLGNISRISHYYDSEKQVILLSTDKKFIVLDSAGQLIESFNSSELGINTNMSIIQKSQLNDKYLAKIGKKLYYFNTDNYRFNQFSDTQYITYNFLEILDLNLMLITYNGRFELFELNSEKLKYRDFSEPHLRFNSGFFDLETNQLFLEHYGSINSFNLEQKWTDITQ